MEQLLAQIDDLTLSLSNEGFKDAVSLMGLIRKQVETKEEQEAYTDEKNFVTLYRGTPTVEDDDEEDDDTNDFVTVDDFREWWTK